MTTGIPDRVAIHQRAIAAILEHARADAPIECCGLVLGRDGAIHAAFTARNELASRTRYRIDPADQFAALRHARTLGLAVVGAYHSHPASEPIPSPRDVREADDPELIYLIVGLPSGELRAYRFGDGNFHPVELVPFC